MHPISVNAPVDDGARRARLFAGELFLYTPNAATTALVDLARSLLEEAFAPHDPVTAQYEMPVEEYAAIYARVKPAFIHHEKAPGLIRDILEEVGCDLDETYQDKPRMRVNTAHGYLRSGAAYALHPHRDTWYSAPMAQVNWWLPIYEFSSESGMSFHLNYWDRAVENESETFNYYEWNAVGRMEAAKHVKSDTRKQPHATEELALDPQVSVVCEPGSLLIFSAAHLHSTTPNTTHRARFSADFRTVNRTDLEQGRSAPNLDSHCTGTSLRDFRRFSDGAGVPEDLVARYDSGSVDGLLVFDAESAARALGQPDPAR